MKRTARRAKNVLAALAAGGLALLGLGAAPVLAQAAAPQKSVAPKAPPKLPFEGSVYLYNLAYDTDLKSSAGSGTGKWAQYRSWLGATNLGAESDPGWGAGDWWDCAQHVNWSAPWGAMQQRLGAVLPTVILGMGQMPSDPSANDSWDQKLAWENATWQKEADNDPTIMAYFANYAKEVDSLGFNKVIIRLGYEFDGGWNPFGNLNVMSKMPGNYIAAWQNIVKTMRANDPKHLIKFCWNPTDSNVQVSTASFYPGDAYVDYVGIDTYDVAYGGAYPVGTSQPTQAQQAAAWTTSQLPRINAFADLARAHGKPMVMGEWGLWQLNDKWHPSGGDNPTYIQNMYHWMSDPNNHVAVECYFEAPSDGDSSLSGLFHPTSFPNAANMFLKLFGSGGKPSAPPTPTGLAAFGNVGKVSLSWNASVGIPSATYSLYRGTKAGGEAATPVKAGLTATTFVNSGLSNGTTYFYTVKAVNGAGASAASGEVVAAAGVPANYLMNGGFETGNTNGWSLWVGSSAQASYVEKPAAGVAHSGDYQYSHWSTWAYQLTLSQTVPSIPSGPHTVSAWVKSSGGQNDCHMEVTANGVKTVVPIAASPTWTQISTTVNVAGGPLTVGFYSNAAGNQWINLDDVVVK